MIADYSRQTGVPPITEENNRHAQRKLICVFVHNKQPFSTPVKRPVSVTRRVWVQEYVKPDIIIIIFYSLVSVLLFPQTT